MRHLAPHLDIRVVEDGNFARTLQRADGNACGLYQVAFVNETNNACTRYVLADSEEGAISQTTDDTDTRTVAIRLPLRVRGWGHTDF